MHRPAKLRRPAAPEPSVPYCGTLWQAKLDGVKRDFSLDANADPDETARRNQQFANASASIEAISEELPQLDRGTFQAAKDWLAGKARDFEPFALGALQLRHVLELAAESKILAKPAKLYADLYQRMDGDRNTLIQDGAAKVDALTAWAREKGAAGWAGKLKPEAKALFKFMHAVTQLAVDPTSQYERLLMRDSRGDQHPWTRDLIKKRIRALQGQIRGRPGDDKVPMMEEIKELEKLPAREAARKKRYPELVAAWNALSPQAKEHFIVMRDHYKAQSEALEQATIDHIESLDIPDQNKRAAANLVRRNFEDAKVGGVYFPLMRFGDYWISAHDKDGEYIFAKYETAAAQADAERRLKASGATIEATGRQDNNYRSKDAPSGTFMGDLIGVLRAGKAPERVQDQIYESRAAVDEVESKSDMDDARILDIPGINLEAYAKLSDVVVERPAHLTTVLPRVKSSLPTAVSARELRALPYVRISVNGVDTIALLDTGTSLSVLPRGWLTVLRMRATGLDCFAMDTSERGTQHTPQSWRLPTACRSAMWC